MHYWISNNIIIKSENAAKSCNQTNKLVLKYISTLSNNFVALDYGCGKLRYTIPLCKTVKSVYAIDSIDQLSRIQVINGRKTSILSYADSTSNLNVFELSEDHWKNQNYDVVFCCNVLSAIPNQDDRIQVLKNIKSVLKTNREALITVQYRNSYFKSYDQMKSAQSYYDGWIINNRGNYTFYGIILPESLRNLCYTAGLEIVDVKLHDGSAFFIVK